MDANSLGNSQMNKGNKAMPKNKHNKLPCVANLTASCPRPFSTSACAGSTWSSLNPRNVAGKVSRNVCVMLMLMMNRAMPKGVVCVSNKGLAANSKALTRLMCTPGNKPVIVPPITPSRTSHI